MSGDTQPFIQTVGTVDHHDQTSLGGEITRTVGNASPSVLDSKPRTTEDTKLESRGDTGTGSGTHGDATGSRTSSEPGVVGEIRTVGSTDPGSGDTAAKDAIGSEQGRQ